MLRLMSGLIAMLLFPAAAWAETASKTVRDWTATCDRYACYARVAGAGGLAMGQTGYQLEIARAGGGHEVWFASLIAHNVPQPAAGSLSVEVPGLVSRDTAVAPAGEDRFGFADQDALEAIFPALRKGNTATVRYPSGDTDVAEDFSLSGLAAVLLWIDEFQGQVGNSDQVKAYEIAGDEPVPETERAGLKARLLAASPFGQCQSAVEGDGGIPFEPKKYDLDGGYVLYLVTCNMGAYQSSALVFVEGSDGLEPVPFASYGGETGWGATLYVGDAEFDPATKTLRSYAKFRGIGDCGTWSDFQWTGYSFKLLKYAYKACSDELPDEDADLGDFPVIYEAK